MLTFHQNTAVCDIQLVRFISKKGKPCARSDLFFIDGTFMPYYDFGKLARQYERFVSNYRSKPPITCEELDKTYKEEEVNGTDE